LAAFVVPAKAGTHTPERWLWVPAFRGDDNFEAGTNPSASRPRERRLALLHEGPAALGVVIALEAGFDQFGAASEVALAFVAHGLVGDELGGLDGERSIAGDGVGIVFHIGFELGLRHDAVDETHHTGFLGIKLARGEEDLLGE